MLDPRLLRVILAADAFTRQPRDERAWHELCSACEQVTDVELESLRAALAPADTETP